MVAASRENDDRGARVLALRLIDRQRRLCDVAEPNQRLTGDQIVFGGGGVDFGIGIVGYTGRFSGPNINRSSAWRRLPRRLLRRSFNAAQNSSASAIKKNGVAWTLFRQRVAYAAVVPAVGEIDDQADDQPDDQARPVDPAELVHHVAVEEDAQNRNDRHPRRAERARLAGIGAAQNHHGDAHDDERQQRADIHHFSDVVDGRDAADDRGQQADQDGVLVRRAELRMDRGEEFLRQQAVVGHRVEHARLARAT